MQMDNIMGVCLYSIYRIKIELFFLQDLGVLFWDNVIKRVMVVIKGGYDDVKRYWKRQKQFNF